MKRLFFILLALFSVTAILADKSQSSIKQEKQQANKEIKETKRKIESNKKATKEKINQLNLIAAEISENTLTLNRIKNDIDSIDTSMVRLNDSIIALEQHLVILRNNYKNVLRSIRATRHSTSSIAFIFSSKSFSNAFRRIRYIRQFASWQNGKSQEIKNALASIDDTKKSLVALHSTKATSLKQVAQVQQTLKNNEKEQSQIVANLKKERTELEAYVKQKQNEIKQLDNRLNKIIAEQQAAEKKRRAEAEKKRKEEEKKRKKEQERLLAEKRKQEEQQQKGQQKDKPKKEESKTDDNTLNVEKEEPQAPIIDPETEATNKLSSNFESNKGRLPYPLSGKCRVVSTFGRQRHKDLPNIETNNIGIEIELLSDGMVRSVFDGVVTAVVTIPGYNTVVMVRHGSYLTVYGNLSSSSVKMGDKVTATQTLGALYADPDNNNRKILHFEVRKETEKLNPQHWLK